MHAAPQSERSNRRHRPSRLTVFSAAFVAGAAVAFGVNRFLDVHLAQAKPQVECEPIFVALHSLPQGSPITVWDVALKDWPRAMLPTTALRAHDSFDGMILRHPLREGQPLLSVQLVQAEPAPSAARTAQAVESFAAPTPATPAVQTVRQNDADLWAPDAAEAPKSAAVSRTAPDRTDVEPAPAPASRDVTTAPPPTPTVAASPAPPAEPKTETTADVASVPQPAPAPVTAPEPDLPAPAVEEPTLAAEPPALLRSADSAALPAAKPGDVGGPLAELAQAPAPTPESNEAAAAGEATAPGKSVLKKEQGLAASGEQTTAPQSTASAPLRYLVVPERIALQADSWTAKPSLPPPVAEPTARPTTRSPAPKAPSNQARKPQTAPPPSGRTREQRPNVDATRPGMAQSRPLGGMFPSIAAGIEALSGGGRKPQSDQPAAAR